ncbi:MAG: sugar phosphate nucleotidyltransferase [Dehalococcoidales bacterium]
MLNTSNDLQIVIIAGGLATRLGKLSVCQPKSMIPINGKPFMEYQLKMLKANGFKRVLICLGHLGSQIEEYFGTGKDFGLDIYYSYEEKPLGTAGALKNAESMLDDIFYTIYGDSFISLNFSEALRLFKSNNKRALMTVYKNNNCYSPSNTTVKDNLVIKYDKLNSLFEMNYIEYGVNIFRKDVLAEIPSSTFCDLGSLFNFLIDKRELLAFEVKERFYEIGSIPGLEDFRKLVNTAK